MEDGRDARLIVLVSALYIVVLLAVALATARSVRAQSTPALATVGEWRARGRAPHAGVRRPAPGRSQPPGRAGHGRASTRPIGS
ncbi:MAG: hypothetical protein D6701_10725 [Gemmatimonadetes bacterium]|nr:MAG: hypothetical protein D6701_10725 [Gemmatimonadota bacterium]